ncbi:hypothetical protein [Burkholderia ambifaria]|uniref:hypothetical protein n=1 Tax=Burkholderia ambifaria TaxID=152480 RepID=UPI001588598B|nr:hypothetical protein [Burkholderia ambifaria]
MTYRLCQRPTGADRTIRLFSGVGGRPREIDANRLDRRGRTRASCRPGPSFRQLVLHERRYDGSTVVARRRLPRRTAAAVPAMRVAVSRDPSARRRAPHGRAPQIVPCRARNTRRSCVSGGIERRATDFLP